MSDLVRNNLLRSLRKLFRGSASNGLTDADLLARFVQSRDEEAFELLMWRYSALVLRVCWQVLRDEQAVEDAFQATFLVLLRKAKSISQREALAGSESSMGGASALGSATGAVFGSGAETAPRSGAMARNATRAGNVSSAPMMKGRRCEPK